ncbi:hypothetical protein ACFRFU_19410 [Streptomyces sp. NPDC056704]|uniref:hypothetical protein n=1 Tax=Streptomyces sp. NPDC056704 TaxID=3345917 RepID=UPI0036A6DA5B
MTGTIKTPPQHGERRCYLRGCRRPECVQANRRYCKQYRIATIRQPVRVDATPVRQRVEGWSSQGYSHVQIAQAVGGNSGDISKILDGQPTIAPRVAARYLTSPGPTGIPFHATADSTGTVRRGRALHAIGYPLYEIARGLPVNSNYLGRILDGQYPTIRAAVAEAMTARYRQLQWKPGPSHFAVHSARRRDWHGPFAWDDNIDDPQAKPEKAKPYKPADQYRRDPDRTREIEHLYLLGESPQQITKKLGGNEKYIRDQLNAVIAKRAAKAEQERLAAKRQRKQVAA